MKFLKRKKKVPLVKDAEEVKDGIEEMNGVVNGVDNVALTVQGETSGSKKEGSSLVETSEKETEKPPLGAVQSRMLESSDDKSAATSKSRLFGLSKKKSSRSGLLSRKGSRKSSKKKIDAVIETLEPVEGEPEPIPQDHIDSTESFSLDKKI